jgi:GTPase
VDQTFEVRGVGSVVSGTVVAGAVAVGQRLLLGPNADAGFTPVIVTCIQRSQVAVLLPCRMHCSHFA